MGKAQTFTIGDRFFSSKIELECAIRHVLHNSGIGVPLPQDAFGFIYDVFLLHPRYEEKVGIGVKEIIVAPDGVWNKTLCFWIIRHDSTKADFSFGSCIRKDRTNEAMQDFKAAGRRAIDPQIAAYREAYIRLHKDNEGQFPCEKTGRLLRRKEEHVDHIPPQTFDRIVLMFMEQNKIDAAKVEFNGYDDGEVVTEFKDEELKSQFTSYHKNVATLRVICKTENLKQSRKTPTA